MNNPKATIRVGGTTETRTETILQKPQETGKELEANSFADQTHRASAVTPVLSEMLAQVEGVARWGLNE